MENIIKLTGQFGLTGLIIYIGYLFYDKNFLISILLLSIGIILSILIIWSEVTLKIKLRDAPWLFK